MNQLKSTEICTSSNYELLYSLDSGYIVGEKYDMAICKLLA